MCQWAAHATLDEHGKVVVPDLEEEYDWLDELSPYPKKAIAACTSNRD